MRQIKSLGAAFILSSEQGTAAEPVNTDRMWMTGTCLGMHSEIFVSDLEHARHAAENDKVIHLSRSTSRVSYCGVTLLNPSPGDFVPVNAGEIHSSFLL